MRKALLIACALIAAGVGVAASQANSARTTIPVGGLAMVYPNARANRLHPEARDPFHEPPVLELGITVRVIVDPAPPHVPDGRPFEITEEEGDRWVWVRVLEGKQAGKSGVLFRDQIRPVPR